MPFRIVTGKCLQCDEPFERKANARNRERGKFCSQTCSARNASAARQRAHPVSLVCSVCNGPKSYGSKTCGKCRYIHLLYRTLGELREMYGTHAFHAKVRGLARNSYKGVRACAACGYDLHVDICHVRDVSQFSPEATIAEVNAQTNLTALDKRCHWEFDNGYLVLADTTWTKTAKSRGQDSNLRSSAYEAAEDDRLLYPASF